MSVDAAERAARSTPDKNFDILRRLGGVPKVRKFATIDIEATDWVKPYAVGFYDGVKYQDWIGDDCIAKALDSVLRPEYVGYWIYAHNGGNYDFTFFLRRLLSRSMERRFKTEITPIGSCMFRLDVYEYDRDGDKKHTSKHWKVKWTFIDSARLMPIKLSEMGETFGITKKVELTMSYNDLAKPENRELMRRYLKTDCVSLYQGVGKIQGIINKLGGQLGPTLPATSLDLFRRRYQRDDIYTNRHFLTCKDYGKKIAESECEGCGHEFIRDAYFGGRTEIFRMKYSAAYDHDHPEAYLFDVNSMYPACMLAPMPVGSGVLVEDLTEAQVYSNAKIKTGIVDCDVEIPDDCYLPPLPYVPKNAKGERKGKLIFPTGRFSGTWDTAELCLLKKVGGRILRTRKSMWFEEETIFTRFVKTIYKYRDKSDPLWNKGMDWIAKILLNAAYGKFAMREERSRFVIHPDDVEDMTPIDFDADIWQEDLRVTPSYIVPQLAVHITALARAQLWGILYDIISCRCDKRCRPGKCPLGGRIYYCDTDSVVCSGVKLKTGGELGMLKLENTITRAEFVLPKLYLIETLEESKKKKSEKRLKVKAKGMGPGIRINEEGEDSLDGQLSEKEFFDLVKNGVPIQRHRLTKFREALASYLKSATEFPRIVSSPKQIQSQYDKRTVLDDFDTKPLKLWPN